MHGQQNIIFIALSLQQWLRERSSVLPLYVHWPRI
jgi:hypothetical protein